MIPLYWHLRKILPPHQSLLVIFCVRAYLHTRWALCPNRNGLMLGLLRFPVSDEPDQKLWMHINISQRDDKTCYWCSRPKCLIWLRRKACSLNNAENLYIGGARCDTKNGFNNSDVVLQVGETRLVAVGKFFSPKLWLVLWAGLILSHSVRIIHLWPGRRWYVVWNYHYQG